MRLSDDLNPIPSDYQFFELQEEFYNSKTTPQTRTFNWRIIPELFKDAGSGLYLEPLTEQTSLRKRRLIAIGLGQCWKFDNPGYAALFKQKLVTHKIKGISHRKRVHNWLRYLAFDNPPPKLQGKRDQLTPICNDPLCFNPLHQRQHKTEWISNFLNEHGDESRNFLNYVYNSEHSYKFKNPPYTIAEIQGKINPNPWVYMFTNSRVDKSQETIHISPISKRGISKICMRLWYDPEMFFRRLDYYKTTFHTNAIAYGLVNNRSQEYIAFDEFWERFVLPVVSSQFVKRVNSYE